MQAFFSGTIVILYFISHYLAEPIFIVSCVLPVLYAGGVMLFLHFGGCGRMISAQRKAKRLMKRKVISGADRALFYKKCVKGTPPAVRAAYRLFSEGKASAEELTLAATSSIKLRGELVKGGMTGVAALCSLSVFLCFYFVAPIGEALLRTAICAFFAVTNAMALRFLLYGFLSAAEKAAERFARLTDERFLRVKKEDRPRFSPGAEKAEADKKSLCDLRALLQELDEGARGASAGSRSRISEEG